MPFTYDRPGGDLPDGYSGESDLLLTAYRTLCDAVDAQDAEERRELAPLRARAS